MTPWLRSPALPIAVLLVVAPGLAVAQFRAMAPGVTIALALAVVAHWRNHGSLPWPRATPILTLSLALLGWGLASAFWSVETQRGIVTVLSLAGLVLLGAAASRALAEDEAAHLRRLGPALAIGLGIGIALLGFDHATQNLFRRAVRGLPDWAPAISFGLKPAVAVLAVLIPLVLGAHGLSRAVRFTLVLSGVAVALWLPGESAKIATVVGLLVALAALSAPRAVTRAAAFGLALVFLIAPLLVAMAMPRLPDISPLPFSAAHRVLIWDFVTERALEHPIRGWGMEASRAIPGGSETFPFATLDRFGLTSANEQIAFSRSGSQRLPLHPHNAALQIWLELGLVGALLATGLALAVIRAAGGAPIAAAALGAATAGAVTGQLSFGVWQPWWVATLVFAAVLIPALGPPRRG